MGIETRGGNGERPDKPRAFGWVVRGISNNKEVIVGGAAGGLAARFLKVTSFPELVGISTGSSALVDAAIYGHRRIMARGERLLREEQKKQRPIE